MSYEEEQEKKDKFELECKLDQTKVVVENYKHEINDICILNVEDTEYRHHPTDVTIVEEEMTRRILLVQEYSTKLAKIWLM